MLDAWEDDDTGPLDIVGPFSVPIDAFRHYEWNRETGWKVVPNGD
jgi:hypothetical protein